MCVYDGGHDHELKKSGGMHVASGVASISVKNTPREVHQIGVNPISEIGIQTQKRTKKKSSVGF